MSGIISSVPQRGAAAYAADVHPVAVPRKLPPEIGLQELLGWLATQLSKSDAAIREQMNALASSKDQTAALATIKTALDTTRAGTSETRGIPEALTPESIKSSSWYQALPDGDPTKVAVDNFLSRVGGDATSGYSASGDDMKALSDTLGDRINANTSSNEMDMLKLQSAISARGQSIQMISNIVAAMHETEKSVVGNIRA